MYYGAIPKENCMKKAIILIVLATLLVTPVFSAVQGSDIGVGLTLGYPTGLTMRYDMDDFRVLGNLTWDFGSGFYIDGGALFDITTVDLGDIPLEINGGALVGLGMSSSKFAASVNGVIGASYYLEEYPVEVFLNLAPGLAILPGLGFSFKGGLGALWYF